MRDELDLTPKIEVEDPQALRGLVASGMLLAGELSLDRVLQLIVDIAREIGGARYAALAVLQGGKVEKFVTSGMGAKARERIGNPPRGLGVLGLLVRDARPIRLADIARHPAAVGFPNHHPPMKSFLGVPVMARGSVFGNLYLADKIGAPEFTDDDEVVVVTLAAQAAVAVENARLLQEERRGMEAAMALKDARSRAALRDEALRRAIAAQEAERERLSRELHDETGQLLTSVVLGLGALEALDDAEPLRERINDLRRRAVEALQELRQMAVRIRPIALDDLGLVPAIERLVEDSPLQEQADVTFVHTGGSGRLDPAIETAVYRIIQEALTNVARHASAEHVSVTLGRSPDEVRAVVEDDGRGFDTDGVGDGVGLAGMRERAELLGGTLSIESRGGGGATIALRVPLDESQTW